MPGLKIAVCGKGGVGKTLIAGVLARLLARDGVKVLAVDCDSNPNLYSTLGVRREDFERVKPISRDFDLVEERTGARPGSGWGAFFSLTPKVDDIPEKYSVNGPDGVKLLVVGSPPSVGTGCLCPELALIRELIRHLVLERDETVIMDMEAGLEHFGRGVTKGVDLLVVVTETTQKSLETVRRIARYVAELGVKETWCVVNKVFNVDAARKAVKAVEDMGLPVKAVIPFDRYVLEADQAGVSPLDLNPRSPAIKEIGRLKKEVESLLGFLPGDTNPQRL